MPIKEQDKAILATLERMGLMFSQPTRELFHALFTEDCEYITFEGQRLASIEENLAAHQKLSSLAIFRGARLQSEILSIRFVNATTAVVIARGAIVFRWQKKASSSRMSINTTVLVKQDDAWKVASFQNTRIKPPGIFRRLFFGS